MFSVTGVLTAILVIIGSFMTFLIMLQEGKGGGLASLGGTKAAGIEGVTNPIRRATAYMAGLFFVLAVVLAIINRPEKHPDFFTEKDSEKVEAQNSGAASNMSVSTSAPVVAPSVSVNPAPPVTVTTPKNPEPVIPAATPATPKASIPVNPSAPGTEAPKAVEAPKTVDAPKPVDAPKTTDAPKPVDAPKTTDAPKPVDAPKPSTAPKTDAPKPGDTPKAVEPAKTDAPKTTEPAK